MGSAYTVLRKGVLLWEVPTLYLGKVSSYGWCLFRGFSLLWVVSISGRCPPMGGAYLEKVSSNGRCLHSEGVPLWEVFS